MALVVKDRVQVTTSTTGTGTLTLGSAVTGFQDFSVVGNGNTTYYAITSNGSWEVGIGTYTSSGTTLSRDTVLESSSSGSKISLTGISNVFVTYPASKSVYQDANGNVGIGTSSPSVKLEVAGDIAYNKFQRLTFAGRQQTWKIASYPKAAGGSSDSEMFVINIYDSTDYDQSSYKTVLINRLGNVYVTGLYGSTSPYNVELKTYDDGTNINVYIVANNYCDYYTIDIAYNRISTTITQTYMGTNTYVPTGTKVGDTTNQNMKLLATYSQTVGATNRDMYIDNSGNLGYVSSIRASKTNIENISDTSWLLNINPVTFNFRKKNEDGSYSDEVDGDKQYGLIAEEVEQVNKDLCFYDETENGKELRGVHYSKLVTPILKLIQQQQVTISELKSRIEVLESK